MGKTLQMLWGSWPRIWTNYNDFVETNYNDFVETISWRHYNDFVDAKRVLLPEGIENTKNK